MKKKFFVILIIISMICLYTNAYAATLNQQQQKANDEVNQSKQELNEITSKKNEALDEVNKLNESITKVQSELSDLEDKIEDLDESIDAKEKDLKEKQNLLDERLSAVYMKSGNTYLEALFTGGLINFVSNYDMIKQIAEYDNSLINEVKEQKQELQKEKVELENSKVQVKVKEQELKNQKQEREEKVKALSEEEKAAQAEVESKENELAKINAAVKKATEQAEAEARRKAAEEAAKKDGNNSDNNTGNVTSGEMAWPTRITHKVNSIYAPGGRSDTSGYYGTAHKGVDIHAPAGTPIYAAKEGIVVYVNYSGYGGGWGLYVVIYHGKDSNGKAIYTRYAHGSSIASGISVGTTVNTNTVIMYAGATGAAEGAHLHFEVCVGGMYSQVNPCPYLGISNSRGTY